MGATRPTNSSLFSYTQLVYALQAVPVLVGFVAHRAIARSLLFTLPSIVAIVLAYARQREARGTFLQSHFHWLIQTFWLTLLVYVALRVVTLPLTIIWIGVPLFYLGIAILGLWILYRLVRGWLALRAHKPV
jgi:uncharacterized membrane protein